MEANPTMEADHFQQTLQQAEALLQEDLDELKTLGYPCYSRSPGPTQILSHLYLGDYSDANSVGMLTEMGVTHALNCAGAERNFFSQFPPNCRNNNPIIYKQFDADDTETYDISRHFEYAFEYIDQVRKAHGKMLVYCKKGMNRSAAICIAYLIFQGRMKFLEAVRTVRKKRRKILTNKGFLKQLAVFAEQNGLL